MTDMGLAVGGRRTIVKRVSRTALSDIHGFLKNVIFFPELADFFFSVYKVQIVINFLVHGSSLSYHIERLAAYHNERLTAYHNEHPRLIITNAFGLSDKRLLPSLF